MATRTSQRIARDGIPIAAKATSRAIAKNTISGTDITSNPFTILNNTPSDMLQKVMRDLNIVVEDVEEQIGVFRAEELARAALAEANYKVFLEKLKDMDKPHSDDHSEDLTMGVIDNSKRASSDITMTNNLTKVVMDNDLESDVAESSKGGRLNHKNREVVSNEDFILEC